MKRRFIRSLIREAVVDGATVLADSCGSGDPDGLLDTLAEILAGKRARLVGCVGVSALTNLRLGRRGRLYGILLASFVDFTDPSPVYSLREIILKRSSPSARMLQKPSLPVYDPARNLTSTRPQASSIRF
jgi:hypothetical protein